LRHLRVNDLILVKSQLIEEIAAVDDHIREFLPDMLQIIDLIAPLKTLQKLRRFDGNRLCQIGRSVELLPVALAVEFSYYIYGFHGFSFLLIGLCLFRHFVRPALGCSYEG
jgi:hypothetical protein